MLDKKVRSNLLLIKSVLPTDEELIKFSQYKKHSLSTKLFYNIFDDVYIKKHIYSDLLLGFHFIQASKIKNFFETNSEDYNLLIKTYQKKFIRTEIQRIINSEYFFNTENELNSNFNDIRTHLLKTFKITQNNSEIFNKMLLEILEEDFFETIVSNTINKDNSKATSIKVPENYTQQHYKNLRQEIMPQKLSFKGRKGSVIDLKEENIAYHLTDPLWLRKYFFNKASQTQMCQEGTLAEKFLTSNEFNSQIKKYQNQVINYAIECCSVTPNGIVNIDKTLPIEQSYLILKEQVITTLSNFFQMDINIVSQKQIDKKIEKICTSYYEGTLQVKPFNKNKGSCENEDGLSVWPSK